MKNDIESRDRVFVSFGIRGNGTSPKLSETLPNTAPNNETNPAASFYQWASLSG